MEKRQAIVFGGSGFLGSHVADALQDSGYKVRIFDVLPSPYLREGQEMIVGDILDAQAVCQAAKGCDVVYQFAGMADIAEAHENPVTVASLNIMGTLHALEAARINGAQRFIFASTVYVFSDRGSFYRASKQSAERFVEAYRERYGLTYTILRYGSLYGRRADERNFIHKVINQALSEGKVRYQGTGQELREYIHVADAARLSVKALDDSYKNQHLILTGIEKLRIEELFTMLREMLGGKLDIEFDKLAMPTHYTITPYTFSPTIGHKMTSQDFTDVGQGLLDCLAEAHQKTSSHLYPRLDWLVDDDYREMGK
jgi:UDP-glucose 4-epimerase